MFRLFALGATVVVANLLATAPVRAQAEVALGYHTNSEIPVGSIVSLSFANSTVVVPASDQNSNLMVGVINVPDDSLLTWSDSASNVHVATSGIVSTLVSTAAGPIQEGDRIMASQYPGVGMKATAGARVIGVAQTGFTDMSGTSQPVVDSHGKTHTIVVGQIPLQIQVITYAGTQTGAAALVPPFVQTLADTIATKHVSPLRITLALFLLFLSLILAMIILSSAVRSSMIAIGRNPLSASLVQKGFIRVLFITSGLLGMGLIAMILALKL